MSNNQISHQIYKWMAKKQIKKNTVDIDLSQPNTPPSEWNVAFLTTAGVHLKTQKPFDVDAGDNTVHLIPGDVNYDDLMITHTHYDTSDAEQDINCVFPLEILRELKNEGVIGNISDVHFGMMGYIPDTEKLKQESIPVIIEQLKNANVDVLFASPGWYICHQSVGLIQQAVEKEGIATISISHLPELTERTKVPRALHLKFPLGRSFGQAGRSDLQKKIVLDMVNGIQTIEKSETIEKLPYRWKRD